MTTFKPGDRVKIFYRADGGYGLGTVIESNIFKGLAVEPDEYEGSHWYLDSFRIEKLEAVESE